MKTSKKSFQTANSLRFSLDRLQWLKERIEKGHITQFNIVENLELELRKLQEIQELHTIKALDKDAKFDEAWSIDLQNDNLDSNEIDTSKEHAWVTFVTQDFGTVWFPVIVGGEHIPFNGRCFDTMKICRERWGDKFSFGIAPTSQMLMGNSTRDNF